MKKRLAIFAEKRIVEDTRKKIGWELRKEAGKILDLGCGRNGSFDYRGHNIVGADLSRAIITPNAKIKVLANAEKKLPFLNKEFDVVVFSGVIQYLENHEFSIKEINRVLKQRGRLILSTVNRESLLRRLGVITKFAKRGAGEKNIFSERELSKLLTKEGFEIKKIRGADFAATTKDLSSNLIFVAVKKG